MIIQHDLAEQQDPLYYLLGDLDPAPSCDSSDAFTNGIENRVRTKIKPPKQGLSGFLVLMVLVTAVTGFLMGYDLCIVAVVLSPIRNEFAVCGSAPGDTCLMNELFVAILAPGAMVSSLFGGWAADRFGRRAVLILSDIFFFGAASLMALSPTYNLMLFGRLLLGIGIGMGFVVFPTYMAEVAPAEVRGILVTCQEVAQCVGCLAAYAVAYLVEPETHWRLLLFCAGIPAVLQLLGTLILPESPRWLVCKRRIRQAKKALERISGHQRTDEHESRYSVLERFLVNSPSGYSDSSASRLSRVRATRAVFDGVDEMGIGIADVEDLDHAIRHHAQLSRENTRIEITDNSSLADGAPMNGLEVAEVVQPTPVPAGGQPPLSVLLNLIEEEELRQLARQRKWEERRIRDAEEMTAKVAEHRVSRLRFRWFKFQRAITFSDWSFAQKVRTNIVPLTIAMGCAISQNFTGANTILYYSVDLLKMGGQCETVSAGVMIGVVKLVGVMLMICFLERIGRRVPLLVGTSGTIICHLLTAYIYKKYNFDQDFCADDFIPGPNSPPAAAQQFLVYLLWGLMFFWNISWAGLMFVVASEVLPSNFRGVGMGLTIATFWVCAFIFQLMFQTLIDVISPEYTFLTLACTSGAVLLFVYFSVPEMTGKTLEEAAN